MRAALNRAALSHFTGGRSGILLTHGSTSLPLNSLQKDTCRFVGRVLRDKFALEGSLQDALAKAGGSLEVDCNQFLCCCD